MTQFPKFIGMVHLPPLPGTPLNARTIDECEELAVADAVALAENGADALIIENFGDVPFRAGPVDAATIAMMTRIGLAVRNAVSIPIGVNVLRNDGLAALGIASAIGAGFIRVNVLAGVMATDQGIITGEADRIMRSRMLLDARNIRVFADVLVKHASPLGQVSIADAVEDATKRGLADAVIVSGNATGQSTKALDVQSAAAAAGSTPVYIGSGATPETMTECIPPAYGAIVGTNLKRDSVVGNPIDPANVRAFARAMKATRSAS